MDPLSQNHQVMRSVQRELLALYPPPDDFRVLTVSDPATGNYLLMDEGWDGHRRIHRVWAHVEVRDGKFWIHEDTTEVGIANLLLRIGIPKERIVLAFQSRALREASEFAVA
jgi:hypothetical protein